MNLTTERLLIRQWQDSDRAPFAAMSADACVMRYFDKTLDETESNAAIDRWTKSIAEFGYGFGAAELRETGEFIGVIGLFSPTRFVMPFSPDGVEIGWRLAQPFWGRGLATEGGRACIEYGFEVLKRDTLFAVTALQNAPSRKVMERLGMHDTKEDFDHPALAPDHVLGRHCLYALANPARRGPQ
jgi:RimJ/RimL family protein N-acetyltransferase